MAVPRSVSRVPFQCFSRMPHTRSIGMYFFFASRRRHTRLQGDWSSDVCSSDLIGPKLHFCQGIGVSKFSRPKRDQTADDKSRHGVENRFECFLVLKFRRCREPSHEHAHQRKNDIRKKCQPDRPPRSTVTIDLGKDVRENVSEWEKQLRSADMRYLTKNADERDDANLLSDEVGDQQNDDEDMNEQIIKAETAQARIA